MICKCGFDFCWTCGGPYHYQGEQCTPAGKAPGREVSDLSPDVPDNTHIRNEDRSSIHR